MLRVEEFKDNISSMEIILMPIELIKLITLLATRLTNLTYLQTTRPIMENVSRENSIRTIKISLVNTTEIIRLPEI